MYLTRAAVDLRYVGRGWSLASDGRESYTGTSSLTANGTIDYREPPLAPGLSRSCLFGSGDYWSASDTSLGNIDLADFSVSVWMRANGTNTDSAIVAKLSEVLGSKGFMLYLGASGNAIALLRHGAGDTSINSNVDCDDGRVHHLAVTLERDDVMTIYVDGRARGTVSISARIADSITSTTAFRVGRRDSGSDPKPFAGWVSDLLMVSRLMGPGEVARQYQLGMGIGLRSPSLR